MKKIIYIFIILVILLLSFYILSICTRNLNKGSISVFSNNHENTIDDFIQSIENILLNIYDIDISGQNLTKYQKEYITNVYLTKNQDKFLNYIKTEEDKKYILSSVYCDVYNYLFSDDYICSDLYVNLQSINFEKFHIDERKIVKYSYLNDMHILEIKYTNRFLDKQFIYNVKYYIGYLNNKYYLIGFTIDKN